MVETTPLPNTGVESLSGVKVTPGGIDAAAGLECIHFTKVLTIN